ncbi:putative mitochondrial fission protein ELM1 [Helianthus debilis subsp. tardiflorus]
MHRTVRRAIIIGNGFAGAENQCYGLIRALGLSHRHSLYVSVHHLFCLLTSIYSIVAIFIWCVLLLFEQRVRRPKEGINKWLNWLPVSIHTRLHRIKSQLFDPQSIVSGKLHPA